MLTNVSRATKFVSLLIAIFVLAGSMNALAATPKKKKPVAKPLAAAGESAQPNSAPAQTAPAQVKEWGPYLDVAYELTYWDKSEIREWRERRERELGETLAFFIANWIGKLGATLGNAPKKDEPEQLYRERDYLRLAIAQTIDYLQSDNRESLNSAAQCLDKLKGKAAMPEIAYWSGFVKALQAMEKNDPAQFVAQVYDIWNNGAMYAEQGAMAAGAAKGAGDSSAPYYYRNIVNLVVNRAIIDRRLEDLNALGPLFMMLRERDLEEKPGEGQYLTTQLQRIAEGLTAPDSDRFRLNFTVAMIEAKRLQQAASAKLDTEGMTAASQALFERSRLFNDYAMKWAASRRSSGVVMAVTDYLDLTSFAIQRLAESEKAPAYKYFALLPANDGSSALLKAMAVFNDIAVYSEGGWEKAGYADREVYLKSAHRLWRAIMELSLWTGDFYQAKLNAAGDQQAIFAAAGPMQVVLDSYLDFLSLQISRNYPGVIPDSAYFGASEAADKLAYAFQKVNAYNTDNSAYNLWFVHRLQATELFPFAPREIAQTAAVLKRDGRYNLYLDYFLPIANRFKQSPAVKKWLEEQKPEQADPVRNYLGSVDEIFAALPASGNSSQKIAASSSTGESFRQLREDLQRKPDHPVHRLLRAFYLEEMRKSPTYLLLMKDPNRLNQGVY
ncbi:MAG TPA: hypothetical protein VF799_11635 [Geobacteraceae bacterium]